MLYKIGDIVIVPFSFLKQAAHKYRPAIVVGRAAMPDAPIYWLLMLTGQIKSPWADDVLIQSSPANNLQKPSTARCAKITAVPETVIMQHLGKLTPAEMKKIR